MSYKINVDAIKGIDEAVKAAALATMEALKGEVISAQVMPFDNGDMQNKHTYTDQFSEAEQLHTMLVSDVPQARRLYFHPEYNFQTVNNPNAGGAWLEPWTPLGGQHDFIPSTFESQLKGRL